MISTMSANPEPSRRSIVAGARRFYARIERPFSSISLIGGFVFDAVALTRVDAFWENFWVVVHLVIVTACAIALNFVENKGGNEENPEKLHFWLVNIMQFFFGGIFSTFLVFYFRSGTIGTSWPFLAILAAAFIANERLKKHYARLAFQISLLFLSYYAFAIYLMPILLHDISDTTFVLSGGAALAAIGVVALILRFGTRERFERRTKVGAWLGVLGIFAALNLLYFANLIPPLPLSLKDAGIYDSLAVNSPGHYTVTSQDQGPLGFFRWGDTLLLNTHGQALYAYTAVFSPTAFNTTIVHEWQFYDPAQKGWVTRARVKLPVTGGSDGGWRTFSAVSNITPGPWRVNVLTTNGLLVGRLQFMAVATNTPPQIVTREIN